MEEREIRLYCNTINVTTNYGKLEIKDVAFVVLYDIADYNNAMLEIFVSERTKPINVYYKDVVFIQTK